MAPKRSRRRARGPAELRLRIRWSRRRNIVVAGWGPGAAPAQQRRHQRRDQRERGRAGEQEGDVDAQAGRVGVEPPLHRQDARHAATIAYRGQVTGDDHDEAQAETVPGDVASAPTVTRTGRSGRAALAEVAHAGDRLGRYQVRARLGAGGMGVVYRAHDPDLDREVAIKVLQPDASGTDAGGVLRERLVREAQAMAKLSHANLVTVH